MRTPTKKQIILHFPRTKLSFCLAGITTTIILATIFLYITLFFLQINTVEISKIFINQLNAKTLAALSLLISSALMYFFSYFYERRILSLLRKYRINKNSSVIAVAIIGVPLVLIIFITIVLGPFLL